VKIPAPAGRVRPTGRRREKAIDIGSFYADSTKLSARLVGTRTVTLDEGLSATLAFIGQPQSYVEGDTRTERV